MNLCNVLGVGVDIVSVARVRKILERHPARFPQKLLHPQEHGDYRDQRDPPQFLARRFAAKEALVKALGLGFTGGAYARRIWIRHDAAGRPSAVLPAGSPLDPRPLCRRRALLSIADEKDYAVAYAIILEEENET